MRGEQTPRQNAKGSADSGAESRAAGASCSCRCCIGWRQKYAALEAHAAQTARVNDRISKELVTLRRRGWQ